MTEETGKPPPPECGPLLKRTRERLGLSEDDVAAELRLSPFQIRALEEDDWEHLPGTTYARGYLRSYARLLDLDPDDLLEESTTLEMELRSMPTADGRSPEPGAPQAGDARRSPRGSMRVWLLGLVLIGAAAAYLWQSEEASRWVAGLTVSTSPTGEAGDARRGEAAAGEPSFGSASDTAASAPLPEGWRRMVLHFGESSWVELRDARGERLVYRKFQPGRRVEVEGKPPFMVYLGNARAVQIDYSGQSIAPDSEPGRLFARFVLDAPSG